MINRDKKECMQEVLRIDSPFKNFGDAMDEEGWKLCECFNKENLDLHKMVPKVVYNKNEEILYGVYMYEDGCLYYIDEEEIVKVEPAAIIYPDEEGRYHDENDNVIDDEEVYDYLDSYVCGEADDLSCYVYFEQMI